MCKCQKSIKDLKFGDRQNIITRVNNDASNKTPDDTLVKHNIIIED